MYYYDVLVSTKHKHNSLFTYSYSDKLEPGDLVDVTFRGLKTVGAIVNQADSHPHKTLAINEVWSRKIPPALVLSLLTISKIEMINLSDLAKSVLGLANKLEYAPESRPGTNIALHTPTNDQQIIIDSVFKKSRNKHLLHGVTGSGKTLVYKHLAERTLKSGCSVIVLAPEIGLSSALAKDFEKSGFHVHHVHSAMTLRDRRAIWSQSTDDSEPKVIIGPRSSLFLPIAKLGLIIMDEFHDDSYKQEGSPRYTTLHVASAIAQSHNAGLLIGSATPDVGTYYIAQKSGFQIHKLPDTALASVKPSNHIIEKKIDQTDLLAADTIRIITKHINKGHQVLVYLNRRGTARIVQCGECMHIVTCNKCDQNLVLHADIQKLVCHGCSRSQSIPASCPECSGKISYKSLAIKSLEGQLAKIFPSAKITRFDSDNSKDESLYMNLNNINQSKGHIIIGTQIISKGLDLPLLGAVVVVQAENSLSLADYRSNERLYQDVVQLKGRVGRGHIKNTEVIVQTQNPNNRVLKMALDDDWQTFYNLEIDQRLTNKLPPFTTLAIIRVKRKTARGAEQAANRIKRELSGNENINIMGPTPAFREKTVRGYEWVLLISSKSRRRLLDVLAKTNTKEVVDLDPIRLF